MAAIGVANGLAPKRAHFYMIFREREAAVLVVRQSSGHGKELKRRLFGN